MSCGFSWWRWNPPRLGQCFFWTYIVSHNWKLNDLFDCYLTSGGMNNEEVSVAGNEKDREWGEEDAGGLNRPDQLAQNLLKKKKTFSCVFVYFNLPCSVQESNSWWGCRQEWEAWRRSRGGCRTRPRWRWRCSAWSASPLRIVQANIKFNKTFV